MLTARRRLFVGFTALIVAATIALRAQSSGPLIPSGGLQHIGSFSVPAGIHAGGQANAGFEYGGTALGYNPAANSLYIVGHVWDQFVGEISIPALGETATLQQMLTDATEGRLDSINPSDPNSKMIGGTLPWGNNLIVSAYSYYDGNGSQVLSHFVRPLNLGTSGQVTGPLRVGPLGAGFYSGYMGLIPSTWQARLGGPALTGNGVLGVISRTSYGPAASAFDPDHISSTGAQALVYYPETHQTLGPWAGANPYFGGADSMKGIVFPVGTSTVLFFGRHGTTFCYGPGTSDPSLAGKIGAGFIDPYCYDPTDDSKGVHGYPYYAYVWAYDANELAAVHAGQKQPWDVRPYAVWPLSGMGFEVGGAAYDPATGRIYVSEKRGGGGNLPLIHVFIVSGSTTALPPKAPTNVRVVG